MQGGPHKWWVYFGQCSSCDAKAGIPSENEYVNCFLKPGFGSVSLKTLDVLRFPNKDGTACQGRL